MENCQTLKWLLSALKSSQEKNKKHFTIHTCQRRHFINSSYSISEICILHFFNQFLMSSHLIAKNFSEIMEQPGVSSLKIFPLCEATDDPTIQLIAKMKQDEKGLIFKKETSFRRKLPTKYFAVYHFDEKWSGRIYERCRWNHNYVFDHQHVCAIDHNVWTFDKSPFDHL